MTYDEIIILYHMTSCHEDVTDPRRMTCDKCQGANYEENLTRGQLPYNHSRSSPKSTRMDVASVINTSAA